MTIPNFVNTVSMCVFRMRVWCDGHVYNLILSVCVYLECECGVMGMYVI